MRNNLYRQIEKILDESEGERRRVIVHMDNTARNTDPVLEAIAEAIRRGDFLLSARELLPDNEGRGGRSSGAAPPCAGGELFARVAATASVAPTIEEIKQEGVNDLRPLLSSNIGQRAIDYARESQGSNFD